MILTPKHLLERICNILEINEAKVRSKKRGIYSHTRFIFYYVGFNDFCFNKSILGNELGVDWSCAINGINQITRKIENEDLIVASKLRKIRYELGVNESLSDTIIEKQYDFLLAEFMQLKKQDQKKTAEIEKLRLEIQKNKLLIKQLTTRCFTSQS